jgi:chloramphenicol 3-O-phosphotransferase
MADILILSGPPGAGKTAVADALAERYDRVAHIQVDTLRHFITPTGYVPPSRGGPAWERQQLLAVRNACCLAENFIGERIGVIIDDVITGKQQLEAYIEGLQSCNVPVHSVRLLPSLEECERRDAERGSGRVSRGRVEAVYREIEAGGDIGGVTVDSTNLTVYETADEVQRLTTHGLSIVWSPATR